VVSRSILLAAVLGAACLAAGPPPSQTDVDAAIRRGVKWLRKAQSKDGSFGWEAGATSLSLLALRHSGVKASDPAAVRAARRLQRILPDATV